MKTSIHIHKTSVVLNFGQWLCIVAIACVMVACNTNGCLENRSSIPLAGLYSADTDAAISLDSIEVTGIGASADDPLYKAGTGVSKLYLPMRSTQEETSWQIAYKYTEMMGGRLCDTITFGYTASPYFSSEECGVIYNYSIHSLHYTTHVIERVEILDSLVSNTDVERIRIYFRTE